MYQKLELAALIEAKPKEASARILSALREAKAHKGDAAKLLGCSHQTLLRWIVKLGIAKDVDRLVKRAETEGWTHGKVGGRPPGRDKQPRKRRGSPRRSAAVTA